MTSFDTLVNENINFCELIKYMHGTLILERREYLFIFLKIIDIFFDNINYFIQRY